MTPYSRLAIKEETDPQSMIEGYEVCRFVNSDDKAVCLQNQTNVLKLFIDFKKNLCNHVNLYGSSLPPHESIYLIWDTLAQLIISNQKLDENLKEKYSIVIFEYWDNISLLISKAVYEGLTYNHELSDECLKNALNQLSDITNFLKSQTNLDEQIINQLKKTQAPLQQVLKSVQKLSLEEKEIFFIQYFDFQSSTLANLAERHLYMDTSKKSLQIWLISRSSILEIHFKMLIQEGLFSFEYLNLCSETTKSLKEQNWLKAYEYINTLLEKIAEVNVFEIREIRSVNEIRRVPEWTAKVNKTNRGLKFASALLEDFKQIISQGNLYNVVSEVAYESLHKSYTALSPLSKNDSMIPEFELWIKTLKKEKFSDVQDVLKDLQHSWVKLKKIQEDLLSNKKIKDSFNILFKNIENENYQHLIEDYSSLAYHLPIKDWENELRQLNLNIKKLQDFCILIFTDPKSSKIDLNLLQKQFKLFNNRLKELIITPTKVLNSFQQLISMNHDEVKKYSRSTTIELHRFEEDSFTLNLFQTKKSYFDTLSEQLSKIQFETQDTNFEIEIITDEKTEKEDSLTSEDMGQPLNPDLMTDKVTEIFQEHTKTRKIIKSLKSLFKEYNLLFNTQFGKGDHNKLYVNGIPIVLPEHKEWKPGTLHSIQNDVILQLQVLIKENTRTDS